MSKNKHVIMCSGAEMNMADMIAIQELLQEVHGFANYHYEKNKSAKYLTVEIKFHADSRDKSVYNPTFSVTTNAGSVSHQQFVRAPKPSKEDDIFSSYNCILAECATEGWTHEYFEGSVKDAILAYFPEDEIKEEYRYCEAFLSRWVQLISGEACGKPLTETVKKFVAKKFPSAPLEGEMFATSGTRASREAATALRDYERRVAAGREVTEDFDAITHIIVGNKGEDQYMVCEIHKPTGLVFRGRITSEYQLGVILNSLGLQYDW